MFIDLLKKELGTYANYLGEDSESLLLWLGNWESKCIRIHSFPIIFLQKNEKDENQQKQKKWRRLCISSFFRLFFNEKTKHEIPPVPIKIIGGIPNRKSPAWNPRDIFNINFNLTFLIHWVFKVSEKNHWKSLGFSMFFKASSKKHWETCGFSMFFSKTLKTQWI